ATNESTEALDATSTTPIKPGDNGTFDGNSIAGAETDVDIVSFDSGDASNETDGKEPPLSSDDTDEGKTTGAEATNEATISDQDPISAVTSDDELSHRNSLVITQLTGGACDLGALGRSGQSGPWLILAAMAYILGRRRK